MLFSADAHAGLADGSITRTFRTWTRPQARAGGRYRVGGMLLEAERVSRVAVRDLTDADAVAAGEADLAALLRRLDREPMSDAEVWRVDLRYVGADDRVALRADADLSDEEIRGVRHRLERLDGRTPGSPWTLDVLRIIDARPGEVSTELATALGRERQPFKADVRKLKNLGLTESLPVGYRLSPRGRAVLAALSDFAGPSG